MGPLSTTVELAIHQTGQLTTWTKARFLQRRRGSMVWILHIKTNRIRRRRTGDSPRRISTGQSPRQEGTSA